MTALLRRIVQRLIHPLRRTRPMSTTCSTVTGKFQSTVSSCGT